MFGRFISGSLILFLVGVQNSWSWGERGHSAVGYIAEQKLSPEAKGFLFEILGYETLAIAALFPDQVRGDPRFEAFNPYHYVEIPVGQTLEGRSSEFKSKGSAHALISRAEELLLKSDLKPAQKAIVVRYVAHLIGDVHQPLHVGNGVDRGANLCFVRWQDPYSKKWKQHNLHSVWDTDLIEHLTHDFLEGAGKGKKGKSWFGYREFADLSMALFEQEVIYEEVIQQKPSEWYEESRALHSLVYPDPSPVSDPKQRSYCATSEEKEKNKFKKDFGPKLGPKYIAAALPVVEKQILKAGFRLAGFLNEIAKKAKAKPLDSEKERKFLEALLVKE